MRCDLCGNADAASEARLASQARQISPDVYRVLLCEACLQRFERHELEPAELLGLVRTAQALAGHCRKCGEAIDLVAARIISTTGKTLDVFVCPPCAREIGPSGWLGPLPEPLLGNDDEPPDPRYVHALDVQARRRSLRSLR